MSAPNTPKEVSNDPHIVPTGSNDPTADVNDSKDTESKPGEKEAEYSRSVEYSEPIDTADKKKPDEAKESEIAAVGDEKKKDGEEDDEEEEEKEKPMVTAGELFRFADCFDKFLMIFGGICAFINGAGMPAWSYTFGLMLNDLNRGADIEEAVTKSALLMVYVGCAVLVLSAIQVATWMVSSVRQMTRIRSAYFDALLRQDMAWHDEHKPGEISARLAGDTKVIQQGINDKFANGLMNLGMGIFGFGFGFYESWKMTLVMLGTFPFVAGAGIAMAIILTSMTKLSRKGFATAGEISTEVLENIKTVQIFGTEARETARFATALGPAKAATKKKDFVQSIGIGISYGIIFASYAAAFWFASYLIKEGEKNVGQVTSVFFAVLMGSFGLGLVFPSIASFAESRAAAFEVFVVINRKPPIDVKAGGKIIADLKGEIEFRNIKFSYPSRPDMKLFTGDFNCKIPAGTTAAFSGVSGCGKSSTVAMLLRYYDPQEGQILVDGVDLKELDVAWWRQNIGIVSQEPNLFSGTVADNIRLGRPDATPQEIKDACVAANINETIEGLPNGYETLVGQVGGQLSGGQKQRIAIARAIVKKPKILFLDEATSALDRKSETEVQEALDGIMKGKDGQNLTVVVIAHRLTTIHSADQIHYLTYDAVVGSQLAESGTFTELVEKKGHFAVMADKLSKVGMGVASPETAGNSTGRGTGANASTRNQEVAVAGGAVAADDADGDGTPEKPLKPDEIANWETDKTDVQTARIIALNEGHTWSIVIGMIGSLLSGGLYPAYAVILSKMLETLAKGAYDKQYLEDQAPLWAGLFIAVGFVAFLGWALQGFYGVAGAEMSEKLRLMLFQAILRQDMPFFDTPGREVGALGANLSGDCEAVHQLWGPSIGFKIQMACNLLVGLTISFIYSWKIALVVLAAIPLMIFTGAIQQMLLVGFGNTNDGDMTDDAVAAEALTNIRTVTSFNAGPEQVTRYTNLVLGAEGPQKRNGVVAGIAFGCSQFTFYGVFALAFWYGGTLIAAGEATFGDVLIASMALLMGAMGAGEAGGFAAKLEDADVAAKRVFAMIDRVPTIDGMAMGGKREFDDSLEIELNKINFNYPARPDATVLTGLETAFTGSNSYGLMGKTGCGKSTIMQLLARFYDPNQGEVLINGDNLNSFDLKSWRSQISIVMQEPALFSGTIKENITYGVDGDHVTEDEIEMVASLAQIHEDILKMPDGYHTLVGYRGNQLSGGQKQRVAIARALLRRPKILLLDEATSALDNATEAAVQQGIATAVKEHPMMVVSIAHRLTTIRDSSKILLLEEGSILEEGSHDELIAQEGEYKARWDLYTASSS